MDSDRQEDDGVSGNASSDISPPSSTTQAATDAPAAPVAAGDEPSSAGAGAATTLLGAIMSGLREALGMEGSVAPAVERAVPLESTPAVQAEQSNDAPADNAAPPTQPPTSSTSPTASASIPPHFFRLPFNGPDGRQAVLAFQPMMVPNWLNTGEDLLQHLGAEVVGGNRASSTAAPPDAGAREAQTSSTTAEASPTAAAGAEPSTGSTTASTPPNSDGTIRYVPAHPTILPAAASPLPFPIIIDTSTRLGWPIVPISPAIRTGNSDAPMASFVSGPPFHIVLQLAGEPAADLKPSPLLAEAYVGSLERADAELRERMARLGMGNIGVYSAADGGEGALGCGICLEAYDGEDKPSWLVGADEQVVAVDCRGHHTLHAGCLRDWLANLVPGKWTCPFCRQPLAPTAEHIKVAINRQKERSSSAGGSTSSSDAVEGPLDERRLKALAKAAKPSSRMSLRDDIRHREREQGWRCDAPACLPLYADTDTDSEGRIATLVELAPCHHRLHQDCLSVAVKVDDWLVDEEGEEGDDDGDGDGEEDEAHVGKWINCPTCRKEAWVELPRGALQPTPAGHKKRIRLCSSSPDSTCVKKLRAEESQVEAQLLGAQADPVIMDVD